MRAAAGGAAPLLHRRAVSHHLSEPVPSDFRRSSSLNGQSSIDQNLNQVLGPKSESRPERDMPDGPYPGDPTAGRGRGPRRGGARGTFSDDGSTAVYGCVTRVSDVTLKRLGFVFYWPRYPAIGSSKHIKAPTESDTGHTNRQWLNCSCSSAESTMTNTVHGGWEVGKGVCVCAHG